MWIVPWECYLLSGLWSLQSLGGPVRKLERTITLALTVAVQDGLACTAHGQMDPHLYCEHDKVGKHDD